MPEKPAAGVYVAEPPVRVTVPLVGAVLAVTLNEFRGKAGTARRFLPGGLGVVTWLNLTLLSGVLAMIIVSSHKLATGAITAAIVGVVLGALVIWERRRLG